MNAGLVGLGLFPDDHGAWDRVGRSGLEFDNGSDELAEFLALGLVDLVVDLAREIEIEIIFRRGVFGDAVFDVVVDGAGFFLKFDTVGNGGGFLGRFSDDGKFLGDEGAVEDTIKSIVGCGGNGVGFVIVAASAGDGQPHGGPGRDIDTVCDDEVVLTALIRPSDSEEAKGSEFLAWEGHEVGGDLTVEELVVGKGRVEGTDDPIAVGVSVGVVLAFWICSSLGVSVAGDIEPMAGPAFAKGGTSEEILGEVEEPVGAGVGYPLCALVGRGKEAGEDVKSTADEDFTGGLGGGREVGLFEVFVNEFVDGAGVGRGHFEGPVFFRRGDFLGFRGIFKCQGCPSKGEDGHEENAHREGYDSKRGFFREGCVFKVMEGRAFRRPFL